MGGQGPNIQQFEAYFQRADVDRDGRISGSEAVGFLQASNLPRQVLAQIWNYADQNRSGFLSRPEFYNALKLVTVAQSKKDLTPELVKAALYGPASSKIPAPQINLAVLPASQPNMNTGQSPGQMVRPPTSNQGVGLGGTMSNLNQQSQASKPPLTPSPASGFQAQPGSSTQGVPGMGSMPASQHSNSFNSLSGTMDGSGGGISSQVPNKSLIPSGTPASADSLTAPTVQSKPPQVAALLQPTSPMNHDAASLFSQVGKEGPKSPLASGNGFTSGSMFGDPFSAKPQPHLNSTPPTYSAGSMPVSSAGSLTYSKDQPAAKINSTSQPPAAPSQQFHPSGKTNQNVPQKSSVFPPTAGQSQAPWPRMTQADVQKYSKVFVQVDTDKDGKITGEQARNLFLSWRLPREVLKQVWDLSDQDNDSMLSLREFCIALYLMERFREGRPLPAALPASVMVDEAFLHASGQPNTTAYGNMSWRPPTPGFQQSQGTKNARLVPSAGGGRPPRPVPVPQPDEPVQQKAKVPELEKHLLDQLSKEEQDSLNKKLEEAKEAEKRVVDLEKDIHEARQKIQFYHAKMQELILYKSRCDNRLNEISEKVVADKREADSLAKKYEEKYKQGGDVASRLTLEEATFRDIQEKKMELYRSIVKLEQENADNVKDRATQIQSDLDELVKALNERCKTYGLRGKPTSLVELPFGWQPGIAATAADWDEVWDKLEEEGYTFVKELTLEVQNVSAPPKPKSTVVREKVTYLDDSSTVKSPSKANYKSETPNFGEKISDDLARTPPDSPAGSNAAESPSKEFHDLRKPKDFNIDGPMPTFDTFDTQSEYGAESVFGDRGFGERGLGSFDTYDPDAAWDFNSAREAEHENRSEGSLFGDDNWGLNPIKTGSKGTDMSMPNQGPFFDSVPSTPLSYSASSSHADSLFMKKPSIFADSVPSTPMYNSTASPRRFSEGSEDRNSFDSSRFDSFNMHDSGPLSSRDSFARFDSFNMSDSAPLGSREFSRFDSMQNTRDSDFYNPGSKESFTRFDSFRSTADSDYNFGHAPPRETFSRFDSTRSSRDFDYGQSFPSFDDSSDPFGSSSPFKTSSEAQWNDDSMDPFGSGAPFKSSFDAQTPRRDDVSDPFGSSGPFKTSFDAQTPRKDDAADPFGSSAPFKTSRDTETPHRGYDSWNAF